MNDAQVTAGGAVRALIAVSRLLAATTEAPEEDVHAAIVREARAGFGARRAVLMAQEPGRRLRVLAGEAVMSSFTRERLPPVDELLERRMRLVSLDAAQGRQLSPLLGEEGTAETLLLLLRGPDGLDGALVLQGPAAATDPDIASAFADAAAAALARLRAQREHERQVAQQQALTRAAQTLNGSLDLDTVLARICQEAASILGSTVATVYRSSPEEGLITAAVHGMPPETVGYRLPPGAGLAGKVVVQGRALLTNDYERIADLPPDAPYPPIRSAMAAPMRWDGALRGVLAVGYDKAQGVTSADLAVLETFAELAATASANASAHAGLAQVARTDGLTGCLNHAAMHDSLRREIERATRAGAAPLSLVLIDLDHFKQVNEAHGHLAGDEVLRRAGHALRQATRPYDLAARYGGDEFALITVEADEAAAMEIGGRALARIGDAIREFLPPGGSPGTAGVAQWETGLTATELVAHADRALLYAKHEGSRGQILAFTEVAEHFRPGRFSRADRDPADAPALPVEREWPEDRIDERLRRRTRQLAVANALGARVAAMADPANVLRAALGQLTGALGYLNADAIPAAEAAEGSAAARALASGRPAVAVDVEAQHPLLGTVETRSQLAVPLRAGDEPWGVLVVEQVAPGAFDDDDATLLQTVAAQVGAALGSALRYAGLDRAYLDTTQALAAALEAKDAYPLGHPRAIAERATAVGRVMGLGEAALRDLQVAAILHDVGKAAVPEAVLGKRRPLDGEERDLIERHSVAGERLLGSVESLAGVRRLVRHEHERFDGTGYPDGLAGEDIPLGSRIILVCDALEAMLADRPYRPAMDLQGAIAELRRNAGSQFDPAVVEALLATLDAEDGRV